MALEFVNSCAVDQEFRLTPLSETSPYALCFGIFCLNLLGELDSRREFFPVWQDYLLNNLQSFRQKRQEVADLRVDKPFLQLLGFTLSALYLIDGLNHPQPEDVVMQLIPGDMEKFLSEIAVDKGLPQTGNLAMLHAVMAIYARDFLGKNTSSKIDQWVDFHLRSMNVNGFWGDQGISHLQFQNGYHQYEIFEYLAYPPPLLEKAVSLIHACADRRGQFAPYFGGGGCYDYDAVSILTSPYRAISLEDGQLLVKTAKTILSEQNSDGGFSESQWIRPRSIDSILKGIGHVLVNDKSLFIERLKYFIAYQHPKHERINTHWTSYSRGWSESNLWDTWFRLQTLARIDIALNARNNHSWGFIQFPGIGYYHSQGI